MNPSDESSKHPDIDQLSDFLSGNLPRSIRGDLEKHIEFCSQCATKMESIGGDTLSDRLLELDTRFESFADEAGEIPRSLLNHDRYELIERIGQGGMGDVFRAHQRSMDRPVAVKVLRKSLFENDRAVARFHNEIKVAAKLNHPNIVHSYDADVSNGLNILVMELVEGEKLSDVVFQNGPIDSEQVVEIADQVISGLAYAHRQGMIHRDIKPQNIMLLPDGTVKITDFGLAKFTVSKTGNSVESLTVEGEVFGTPDYIAPEQIRDSASVDCRSDIYSLGCTLYFLLTGRPPFAENSVGEKLAGHLDRLATPLKQLVANADASLVATIERMMRKEPGERFQDYTQLANALVNATTQEDQGYDSDLNVAEPNAATGPLKSEQASNSGETAQDLAVAQPKSAPRLRKKTELKISRRGWWVAGGIGLASLGIFLSGILPTPFASNLPAHANNRTGNLKFAIVVPAENAYFPEIQELFDQLTQYSDVEFEFVADRVGRISFNRRLAGRAPKEIQTARTLAGVEPSEVDGVIFTGGWNGRTSESTRYAFDAKLNQDAKKFVEKLLAQNKPVGSICGGTAVLANTGLLRRKKVANCRYIDDQIKADSGAIWSAQLTHDQDAIAVVDGLFVTAGNSGNGAEVARLMRALARESRSEQ